MTDETRKLLGGYATGTLTAEERTALFEAALHDPALFEALAEEQTLKDVFDDPAARARLLQAAETPRFTLAGVAWEWLGRTRSKVMVAVAAALVVAIGVRTLQDRTEPERASLRSSAALEAPRESAPVEQKRKEAEQAVRQSPPPRLAAKSSPRSKAFTHPNAVVETEPAKPLRAAESAEPAQVARSGAAELRYVLLREGTEVPSGTVFERDDQVQLRIEVKREGRLIVTPANGPTLYSGPTGPQAPVVVPTRPGQEGVIYMAFSTLPEEAMAMRYQTESSGAGAKRPSSSPAPAPKMTANAVAMTPAVTAEVTIRRKNR